MSNLLSDTGTIFSLLETKISWIYTSISYQDECHMDQRLRCENKSIKVLRKYIEGL